MTQVCHHFDRLVWVILGIKEVESHIMGIVMPSAIDSGNCDANEGIVLDARLLE